MHFYHTLDEYQDTFQPTPYYILCARESMKLCAAFLASKTPFLVNF